MKNLIFLQNHEFNGGAAFNQGTTSLDSYLAGKFSESPCYSVFLIVDLTRSPPPSPEGSRLDQPVHLRAVWYCGLGAQV